MLEGKEQAFITDDTTTKLNGTHEINDIKKKLKEKHPEAQEVRESAITSILKTKIEGNKQTLALRQASEESVCFLLSFFCDD